MNFTDNNNNFIITIVHLSKKFQKELRNNIKDCQWIIHKGLKWKYINLNPSPITIRGLIRILKRDSLIKRIVNWKNAPAYKLVKMFSNNL